MQAFAQSGANPFLCTIKVIKAQIFQRAMRTHINVLFIFLILLTATNISCTSPKEKKLQGTITIEEPTIESCDSTPQNEIFQSVEELPEYPGGSKAMMEYIKANKHYPEEAMNRGIQGRVIVHFVIDTLGNVCDENIIKPIDPQLDAEAIRLVRGMPQWKPGKVRGRLQRVRFTLPITFKLPDDMTKKTPSEPQTTKKESITDLISGQSPNPKGMAWDRDVRRPLLVLILPDKSEIIVEGKDLNFLAYSEFNYLKAFGLTLEDVEHADSLVHYMAVIEYGEPAKEGAIRILVKDKTYAEVTDALGRYWYSSCSTVRLPAIVKRPGEAEAETVEYESKFEGCFVEYEQQPEFPGGMSALMGYIKENLRYPQEAKNRGIQGRVIVQFVVNTDGSPTEERVVKPIDPQLDGEAIRIVRSMPNWKPGEMGGKPMRVRFTFPVTFRLSEER